MRLIRTVLDPALVTAYNDGVSKAVAAHAADMAVEAGVCAICRTGRPGARRVCNSCRADGRREPSNSRGPSPRGLRTTTPIVARTAGDGVAPRLAPPPAP
jgi:hypothetical protein